LGLANSSIQRHECSPRVCVCYCRYFLADEGKSCTAVCEARGGECDAARVTEAAQSIDSCSRVLTDLGTAFDPISGQGWLGDRSGCSFGAKCGAHDYCTIRGVQCPLEHQDADMGAVYAAIGKDDKWRYKGTLKDGRPWFESDSAGDPLRYLYYSSRAGGHLLSATAPLPDADEPWVGVNNQVRLLSGSAQFPEGTWSEARLYCGHDTGPAAVGCTRHERGGDSNKAYYWCDNNGPLSVSCTCSAEDGTTTTAVQPPSAMPPSSSPRQCDMTGDNGLAAPVACADISNAATDSHGSTCADYVSDTSWCGNYDDDDFTAKLMCCACDGGTVPLSATSSTSQSVSRKCSTYEAEDAVIHPTAEVKDRNEGFTGTGYVNYNAREGEYIEWTVDCDASAGCDTSVSWRYALRGGNRDLDLEVNGKKVQTVRFPKSGSSWKEYTSTSEITSIELGPGSNTIRLTSIGSSGANVDSMTVCKPLGAFNCPLEGYEYRPSTRGCRCETVMGQSLSTGEVCMTAGQPLGAIATAHEVLGEGSCTTGDFACIDQGRRACDYVRLHGYLGSIDCFAFSLGKAGDMGGVQLLSSGASFRGDSASSVVTPALATMVALSTPLPTPAPTTCTDTDNGAKGMMGGCGPHMTQTTCEMSAIMYDNEYFTASVMCCACGGGSTLDYNVDAASVSPTCLTDPNGLRTDAGWSTFVAARTHLWHTEDVALASFAPVNDLAVGVLSALATHSFRSSSRTVLTLALALSPCP